MSNASDAVRGDGAALDRLGALHIPAYVVDGQVHGRLRVDPKKLARVDALTLERNHTFSMVGADGLSFAEPSPLSLLGVVSIQGTASERDVVARVQEAWARKAEQLEEALHRARAFAPESRWSPETLRLEGSFLYQGQPLLLRFAMDGTTMWIAGIGATRFEGGVAVELEGLRVATAASKAVVMDALSRSLARLGELQGVPPTPAWQEAPGPLGSLPPPQTLADPPPKTLPPPAHYPPPAARSIPPEPAPPTSPGLVPLVSTTGRPAPARMNTQGVATLQATGVSVSLGAAPRPPPTTPGVRASWPATQPGVVPWPGSAPITTVSTGVPKTGDLPRIHTADVPKPTADLSKLPPEVTRPTADVPRVLPDLRATGDLGRAVVVTRATGDIKVLEQLPRATGDVPRVGGSTADVPRAMTGDFGRPPDTGRSVEVVRSSQSAARGGALPHAPVGSMASPPPKDAVVSSSSPPRRSSSVGPDILIEEPVFVGEPDVSARVVQGRLGAFDDPFRAPHDEEVLETYVMRRRRVNVDAAAVLHVGARTAAARVYNISMGGAFVALDLAELPPVGSLVELGAAGYQPVKARVMHARPQDPAAGVPAGLGLQLLPDASLQRPATMTHVLVASPDPRLRKKIATAVARLGMLPVPAGDVVAAYVASQTLPLSVMVLDPLLGEGGDWRELPEGLGLNIRGAQVLALHEAGAPLRNLPAWMTGTTLEELGRSLEQVLRRSRN